MKAAKHQAASADIPIRIGLLGASFTTGNLGVNALARGAIRTVLQRYPESEIFLLDYDKTPSTRQIQINGREIFVSLVNLRFSKKFYLPNNIARLLLEVLALRLVLSRRLREKLVAKSLWLRHIWQAELFVSLAGGDSFSDIYGLERLLYVALPQILVLLAGKRLVLLPQTLGPFQGRLSKAIGRYILRRAERVYTRDHRGEKAASELIGEHLVKWKTAFCYDLGFVLDPVAPRHLELEGLKELRSEKSIVVGLNVSGLLFMGGYTRDNMFGLRVDYRELEASLVDFFIAEKHARVLLIPHVFGGGPHSESDHRACRLLYEQLRERYPGHIGVVQGTYNECEIKYVISQCDFFIGSRMHACIAALSQSVPTVAVAYSDKFIGVMETIGFESLVADPRKMGQKEILERLADTYRRRQDIRRELERRIPPIQGRVLELFDDIPAQAPVGEKAFLTPTATSRGVR